MVRKVIYIYEKQSINFAELRVKIVLVINRFVKERKKLPGQTVYGMGMTLKKFICNVTLGQVLIFDGILLSIIVKLSTVNSLVFLMEKIPNFTNQMRF